MPALMARGHNDLSYLTLNDQRYRTIAPDCLEYATEAATREHMTQFRDMVFKTTDPTNPPDGLPIVLFNILLQLTNGPAYAVTTTTPDDNGFDTLRLLRE